MEGAARGWAWGSAWPLFSACNNARSCLCPTKEARIRAPQPAPILLLPQYVGFCRTDQCTYKVLLLPYLDMATMCLRTALYRLYTRLSKRLPDSYTRLSRENR